MIPHKKILHLIAVTLIILIGVHSSAATMRRSQFEQQEIHQLKRFSQASPAYLIQKNQNNSTLLELKPNNFFNFNGQTQITILAQLQKYYSEYIVKSVEHSYFKQINQFTIISIPSFKDNSNEYRQTLSTGCYLKATNDYAPLDTEISASFCAGHSMIREANLVQPASKQVIRGCLQAKTICVALLWLGNILRNIYIYSNSYHILLYVRKVVLFIMVILLLLKQLVLCQYRKKKGYSISSSEELEQAQSFSKQDELFKIADTINVMLIALVKSQNKQKQPEKSYYKYSRVLAELTRQTLDESDLNARLQEITETVACTLEVEGVSVWLYNAERSKLQCIELYVRSSAQHSAGMELQIADYPIYSQVLEKEHTIATVDVERDSTTTELSSYLSKFGIKSMLNAPICLNGKVVGTICFGHIGSKRQWMLEEQTFVDSLASLVALLIEASEHKRSQKALQTAYDELEKKIIERTSELAKANEQLQTQIIECQISEQKLLYDAFHDALTGLPNRALFMQRLENAVEKAKQEDDLLAVLFLDLDRFKIVNDTLGHLVGDELLVGIARRLQASVRPGDLVARLGGDEFTILLENIKDVTDAIKIAERIQQELSKPFYLSEHEVFTAASIGIALNNMGCDRPFDLLRDADVTMYRAKSSGKARYEVFDQTIHTQPIALLQLENDLQRAIKREEFRIDYQPIVSLTNGIIIGFEALLRWQHPLRGVVSPREFLPLAQETNLIIPIDWWMLRKACIQARKWQQIDTLPLTINVNFSGLQFTQPHLVELISQILQETGLEASCLQLEINQTAMINIPDVTAILWQLKQLGVRLYIDNFGYCDSCLSYLHKLPIDGLKIDQSCISKICVENEFTQLVSTIITMADKLSLNVVAQGIETKEQLAQLQALQCEYGQGYFFSQPLHPKAVAALIGNKSYQLQQ